jgi:hypothetical protein
MRPTDPSKRRCRAHGRLPVHADCVSPPSSRAVPRSPRHKNSSPSPGHRRAPSSGGEGARLGEGFSRTDEAQEDEALGSEEEGKG